MTAAAPHMLAPEPMSTALSLLSPKNLAPTMAKEKVKNTIKAEYITPMVPTLAISLRLMLKPKSMMPSLKICFPAIAMTPLDFIVCVFFGKKFAKMAPRMIEMMSGLV